MKRIVVIVLIILSLFIVACDKKQQDELNKALEGVDNFYLNGGTNKQNNDDPTNQSEPQDNKLTNKNELLVGIWQSEVSDYYETHGLGRNFYVFNSDGTWQYIQVRTSSYDEKDIYSSLNSQIGVSTRKYSYDGNKIEFDVDGKDDDYHSQTELTINGNSFRVELDYGRYLKEDKNTQIGKFEKYR